MDYHSGLSIWTDDYYNPRLSARSDAAEALRIAEMRMYGGSCAAELSTAPTPLYAPTASVTSSLSSVAALNMPHRGLGSLGGLPACFAVGRSPRGLLLQRQHLRHGDRESVSSAQAVFTIKQFAAAR